MDSKWEKGVWLGTARESNDIVIGTKEGVTRCYAAKRMTEEDRWNADEINTHEGHSTATEPTEGRAAHTHSHASDSTPQWRC